MPRFCRVNISGCSIVCMVTTSGADVSQWIATIRSLHGAQLGGLVVGLNLKGVPNFNNHNTVAVLQLCVGDNCLIFQMLHADHIPPDLRVFLLEPTTTFVGDRILGQITKLLDAYSLRVGRAVDLGIWAALHRSKLGLASIGLDQLSSVVLGLAPHWPWNMSDIGEWNALHLSQHQIMIASTEAALSFRIGCALEAWTCPGMFSTGI